MTTRSINVLAGHAKIMATALYVASLDADVVLGGFHAAFDDDRRREAQDLFHALRTGSLDGSLKEGEVTVEVGERDVGVIRDALYVVAQGDAGIQAAHAKFFTGKSKAEIEEIHARLYRAAEDFVPTRAFEAG